MESFRKGAIFGKNNHNCDTNIHAILWAYQITIKITIGFSIFNLTYTIEGILPIENDLISIRKHIHDYFDEETSVRNWLT